MRKEENEQQNEFNSILSTDNSGKNSSVKTQSNFLDLINDSIGNDSFNMHNQLNEDIEVGLHAFDVDNANYGSSDQQ